MSNTLYPPVGPSTAGSAPPPMAQAVLDTMDPPMGVPAVAVPQPAPVRVLNPNTLAMLATTLKMRFEGYKRDRQVAEQKWLRNLRQYMGLYDPEVLQRLTPDQSRAYPRITRVKCISTLARVMNLMFPGNERNWSLDASPSADMAPEDVQEALQAITQKDQEAGIETAFTPQRVQDAVNALAQERAARLSRLIDDQLQEIGGDQTLDYIGLNRKVVNSGIRYGMGVLKGPMVRIDRRTTWGLDPMTGLPAPTTHEQYKPMFEFLPVWDFYPDMSAKNLMLDADGWFERLVMTRAQVRDLADRDDFFGQVIRGYLARNPVGNYVAQTFEQELRSLGVSVNVNDQRTDTRKYEIIVWHGPVTGQMLRDVGADVPDDALADDIDAEVWMLGETVIKADVNPWRSLGVNMRMIHTFIFDEDDSSPVGNGLPAVIRDSQMSISASTRMLLDNASVICGPNLEVNTALLRADTDVGSVHAYKMWYRDDDGPTSQWAAVRNISIDGHLPELLQVIKLFMDFADTESFVNPTTDVQRGQGEAMRTIAGASMLRGDAALPFKDIIRNFDTLTQSVINAMVLFNRKFNPDEAQPGDYNVIARGATSLIAKELRGAQVDSLATTLTPAEMEHVNERKMVEARFAVRDMTDMLVPPAEADRRQAARSKRAQEQEAQQKELMAAQIRDILAGAFKSITQGQKNAAAADAAQVNTALELLTDALEGGTGGAPQQGPPA